MKYRVYRLHCRIELDFFLATYKDREGGAMLEF